MASGSSLPYRLRPNKAVDRELFLGLLARLSPSLPLEDYHYIGLGGPFLEDFRLVHARLGIARMTSVEAEEQIHKRQLFNRPVASIECVHDRLEDFLDGEYFDEPVIIWFDYTDPRELPSQIARFAQTIGTVPVGSVLRITLNANPSTLGKPDPRELSGEPGEGAGEDRKPTLQEWRLIRFQERMGYLSPAGLNPDGMTQDSFGLTILRSLKLAVEKEILSHSDRQSVWALATQYSDGQAMATATLIVCTSGDKLVEELLGGWEFCSTPENPCRFALPPLSTLERLTMESNENPRERLGFDLPTSYLGVDPFEVFRLYYRVYPHFSRVHL